MGVNLQDMSEGSDFDGDWTHVRDSHRCEGSEDCMEVIKTKNGQSRIYWHNGKRGSSPVNLYTENGEQKILLTGKLPEVQKRYHGTLGKDKNRILWDDHDDWVRGNVGGGDDKSKEQTTPTGNKKGTGGKSQPETPTADVNIETPIQS